MRRGVVAAAVLALGAGVFAAPAAADVPDPDTVQIAAVDTRAFPDVDVTVLTPPRLDGQSIDPNTLAVTEGGVPQATTVTRQPGTEQDIVLAIDVSGGMSGTALDDVKRAASDFVRQAPAGAHIGIVAITTRPQVVAEMTTDTAELVRRIDRLSAGGDSAIADSVVVATDMLGRAAAPNDILLLLTDGSDTSSAQAMTALPALLTENRVSLYTVQMTTAETNSALLQQISREARGRFATADDTAALSSIYESVARALDNLYAVRYQSASSGETRIVVSVRAGTSHRASEPFSVTLPGGAAPAPAAVSAAAPGQGFWASGGGLAVGLVALYLALTAAVLTVGKTTPLISAERRGRSPDDDSVVHRVAERLVQWIDRTLSRRGLLAGRVQALREAGLKMRAGDFVALTAAASVTTGAVGFLLSGPVLAVLFAIMAPVASHLVLVMLADRRRSAFADQLDDSVQLLAGNLRAGHGVVRALDALAREAEAPSAEEFARVVNETRVGRDLGDSLSGLAGRMRSDEVEWMAQAIAIHREVGGDLADVLDRIGGTIRERNQVRRQVKALSAEGKMSAYVLMALPVGIVGFLSMTNPSYLAPFTEGPVGFGLIVLCIVLLAVGGLWLRKLVNMKF